MREPKIIWLMLLVGYVHAQAKFEDADKSNEYTNQNFDLRHTIPGEPGVDYPILGSVPKTSFVCKGRHEGYYADVESRCQVFRICAHTARSAQGFGFLCPNGTLFNQQHFVCDWYRNVNCDESERYYDKNAASRVGSTHDMMETVRQMMEYPMKTISKALQKSIGSSKYPDDGGKKTAITREQVESAQKQTRLQASVQGEAVKSAPIPKGGDNNKDDVYVNSLGELSSDPGIKFDHTNAHIVAEYPREYHYSQQKNFAERVNAGLEEFENIPDNTVMAPDYIKQIVSSSHDEATQLDLVSNINGLLEEDSTNLDTSTSGYQVMVPPGKVKQPFRFLSRGFSMQDEKQYSKDSSYQYIKPKQTESTVRFTPNDIPIETQKDTSSSSYYTQKHTIQKTSDNIISSDVSEKEAIPAEPLQIILDEYLEEPVTQHASVPHHLSIDDGTVDEGIENNANQDHEVTTITNTDAVQDLPKPTDSPVDDDKVDVNLRAANLLLAGYQLTSHNEQLQENHDFSSNKLTSGQPNTILLPVAPSSSSTTELPTSVHTTPMSTSTETITEINTIQERIRSYRRFANQQRAIATTTTTTSTILPIYARRANLRPLKKVSSARGITTTTTTGPATPKTTRNYQQRITVSRLRLSRLGGAKNAGASTAVPTRIEVSSATTPLPLHVDQFGPNKKVSVRNIERETGNANSLTDNSVATWESVHNNLQRFQVNRNRGTKPSTTTTTTTPTPTPTSRSTLLRNRNRFSKFKTQVTRSRGTPPSAASSTTTTTRAPKTTISSSTSPPPPSQTLPPSPPSPPPLSTNSIQSPTLALQLSSLTASLQDTTSYIPPTPSVTPTLTHTTTTHNIVVDPLNIHHTPEQTLTAKQATSSDGSAAASATFLPFDKLTRAIVDDSILQNYKSSSNNNHQQHHLQQQQQPQATARSSNGNQGAQPQPIFGAYDYTFGKQTTPATAASIGHQHRPAQPIIPQRPNIVIARAEGQRIQPNSVNNVLASLVAQPLQTKTTTSNSYVSLNDFLHNKFGSSSAPATSSTAYGNQPQQQQQQQQNSQHHHQQQLGFIAQQYKQPQKIYQHHQQQQQQQHHVTYQPQQHFNQQQQRQQNPQIYQSVNTANQLHAFPQPQYQQQQHESLKQTVQSIQQPYLTPNIFVNYQQHQQQLPQFPPLAQPPIQQQYQQLQHISSSRSFGNGKSNGNHVDYLNIQLPSLSNNLIPSPAQKRSDDDISHFLLASSPTSSELAHAFYSGATSYDVPLNSIGRLPNDITERLRRRLHRH